MLCNQQSDQEYIPENCYLSGDKLKKMPGYALGNTVLSVMEEQKKQGHSKSDSKSGRKHIGMKQKYHFKIRVRKIVMINKRVISVVCAYRERRLMKTIRTEGLRIVKDAGRAGRHQAGK